MRRVAILVGLLGVVISAAATRTRVTASLVAGPEPIGVGSIRGLPVGLRWPADDAAHPVVSAVAADIDDDGDLDVVANQGSTDLAVWVNDGTGQLTRAVAPRRSAGGLLGGYPAVGGPLSDVPVPATTALPVFDAEGRFAAALLCGAGTTTGPPAFQVRSQSIAFSSPRAPPLAPLV